MSLTLFDLGQRLRAATLARPVARSTFERQVIPGRPSRRESHYSWG